MEENRKVNRQRTLRPAKAVWDDSRQAANLVIKDISSTGAQVEWKEIQKVPDSFDLMMLPSKELRPVQEMWRSGQVLGLKFLDVVAQSGAGNVVVYDPRTGLNPIFAPVPTQVRAMLPWAS